MTISAIVNAAINMGIQYLCQDIEFIALTHNTIFHFPPINKPVKSYYIY